MKGFFASNSKYVVCFNKILAGKGFCDILPPLWITNLHAWIDFTSIAVTYTFEETSCCFNFADIKIFIFFFGKL